MKEHVNSVGVEAALASLGKDRGGLDRSDSPQYEGGWDPEAFKDEGTGDVTDAFGHTLADFSEKYLNRHGITLVHQTPGGKGDPAKRLISSATPKQYAKYGGVARPDPFHVGDFTPKDPTLKDKLEEAKNLPGLETSEDINKIVGTKVTHLTPEVMSRLDSKYGKDQWIVKAYGDEAAAGYGIFFPHRSVRKMQDAKNTLWAAGENLARYGFKVVRDKDNVAVGVEHESGDRYDFGEVDRWEEEVAGGKKVARFLHKGGEKFQKLFGDVRHWADQAANAAADEYGAMLPGGGKDFMAQPAFPVVGVSELDRAEGKTIAAGEGRVHIVTRNGRAEIIPHSTWIKNEHLPVVFENDETRAMAQAALDAINALPASERQGQIYAPDIIRGVNGYRVIEANPANDTGSSGYLGNNPLIIDAYLSHLTGRTPAHVRFIRRLLSTRRRSA